MPAPSAEILDALAPRGKLRAALNFGNIVLVQRDSAGGPPRGVTPALANELARRLGVPLEFVNFNEAGSVFEAAQRDVWDIAFLAIDPKRAQDIIFTAPYVQIEGAYAVAESSPIKSNEDVDRAGVRAAVGEASAYELFLTRNLENATLIRAKGGAATIELFLREKLDVIAGVKQAMAKFIAANPGYRMLPGRFMVIEQAMGLPKGREAGARYLRDFVEEMKASGFVAKALTESGQKDAAVAPPQPAG